MLRNINIGKVSADSPTYEYEANFEGIFPNSSTNKTSFDDDWLLNTDTPFEKKVEYILVFCIAITGLVGNGLSFYLLTRVAFRRFSYAAYLRYLAVSDSVNLLVELVLKIDEMCISNLRWSYLSHNNAVTCKLGEFFRHTSILLSSWLVAAFSLDRLVAVTCPLFKFKFCTVRYARLVTASLVTLCAASQIFRLVLITARSVTTGRNFSPCFPNPEDKQGYFVANSFFSNFGMRFLVPFVIIVTSNCIVLQILRNHGTRKLPNSASRFLPARTSARQTRLAKSALYLVCAYFILTMSPSAALEMTWYVFQSEGKFDQYVRLLPFQAPFNLLRLSNYAINFFIYCVSFRSFRHELKLLKRKCGKVKFCSNNRTTGSDDTNTAEKSTTTSSHYNVCRAGSFVYRVDVGLDVM